MIYNKIIMSEEDIIYENNTKGKIYDSYGRLIYEGELLKGKKNGIGKEYVSEGTKSKLIFEGEYLNGERRKGKEYDDYNGKLIFEGEYLNGERRKGKEYTNDGELIFEGDYLNDFKIIDKNDQYQKFKGGLIYKYNLRGDLLFEGQYLDGKKMESVKNIIWEMN